jgi:L-2-hydroxycarboxylate dehydrogenase (NAD+)
MKVELNNAKKLIHNCIQTLGFTKEEAKIIGENVYEAEISGKKSHGLGNLLWFKRAVTVEGSSGYVVKVKSGPVKIAKETPVSIHLNGNQKPGHLVIRKALDLALKKVKKSKVVLAGLYNTAPSTGCVGYWAREATKNNLIFISWNNSNGKNTAHGSTQRLYGTNPITIGIPTNNIPIILDMATSKITAGKVMNLKRENKPLPPDSAIDSEGNMILDAEKAWVEGALLPIAGHKGSGLMFIGEMLAGALTGSRVGHSVKGGWGTFFILFDPTLFRPLKEFKKDIDTAINELKSSKKRAGVKEIFYPGEQSGKTREKNIEKGFIEVDDELLSNLKTAFNLV